MLSAENPDTKDSTLEIYRRILNFNFVGKYDPKLKAIHYQAPHAVLYKFNLQTDGWEKVDCEGSLVFYERNIDNENNQPLMYDQLRSKDNYKYGLMIINRNNPKNISLGIIPAQITTKYREFYGGMDYEVQVDNELLMLKNHLGDVYGIWMMNVSDRDVLLKLVESAIKSQS